MENKTQLFDKTKDYIIRADKAGVFKAKIEAIVDSTIILRNVRRLYYWSGALDVITIAKEGVSNPNNCKFSIELAYEDLTVITNLIEFHPMSEKAINSINSIKVWTS